MTSYIEYIQPIFSLLKVIGDIFQVWKTQSNNFYFHSFEFLNFSSCDFLVHNCLIYNNTCKVLKQGFHFVFKCRIFRVFSITKNFQGFNYFITTFFSNCINLFEILFGSRLDSFVRQMIKLFLQFNSMFFLPPPHIF